MFSTKRSSSIYLFHIANWKDHKKKLSMNVVLIRMLPIGISLNDLIILIDPIVDDEIELNKSIDWLPLGIISTKKDN